MRRWTTCGSSSISPSGAGTAGVGPLQAARDTDLGRFTDWPDAERIVGNLHRAYAELDGPQRGAPIDVMAALADMVDLQRRRPADLPRLNCVAVLERRAACRQGGAATARPAP